MAEELKRGGRESLSRPEISKEQEVLPEQPSGLARETAVLAKESVSEITPIAPVVVPVAPNAPPLDPEVVAIEQMLADDLGKVYEKMSPDLQKKFRAKGEEVARKIHTLIKRAHAHAKTILVLIRNWLRMIPGVNRFFLEQEAKIKTDNILNYAEKENEGDESAK